VVTAPSKDSKLDILDDPVRMALLRDFKERRRKLDLEAKREAEKEARKKAVLRREILTVRQKLNREAKRKRNGYAFKTYGSPLINILGHVKAEQPRFLSAVYSFVNEWIAHGMPRSSDTRGQGAFRLWWQIIDWITLNLACLPSPLEGHQAAQAGASKGNIPQTLISVPPRRTVVSQRNR
jgi:hypothetical protein